MNVSLVQSTQERNTEKVFFLFGTVKLLLVFKINEKDQRKVL